MLNFLPVILAPPETALLYQGHYDVALVACSVMLAIFASYASLQVSHHVAASTNHATRRVWIAAGGLCLGLGIWAMHFVGMLAFSLPCSSSYDATITVLSTVPGILASSLAIGIISRPKLSHFGLATGGLLIGAGVGAMHYSGMAAMRLNGLIRYDASLFLLSILVAIALATLALWIKFRLQEWQSRWSAWATVASAVVMGLAVSGMHYTAMAATYFIRDGDATIAASGITPSFLAAIILTATSVIVVVTIVATFVGNRNLLSLGRSYKLIGALVVGWCFIAWLTSDYYHQNVAKADYERESQHARQQVEEIAGSVGKDIQLLKGISSVVSGNKDTRQALRRFGGDARPSILAYETRKQRWTEDPQLAELSRSLDTMAVHLKTNEIFVLNAAGDCIAAGNSSKSASFVGTNYANREYFQQARAGQLGHQYAMGRTSKLPGLYYSTPVSEKGRFLGAVVVKRNLSDFSRWTDSAKAFIADANGVIVLAADKQLEFRILPGASATNLSPEQSLLQYKQPTFKPLDIVPYKSEHAFSAVLMDGSNAPSILASKVLPEDAITIYVPRSLGGMTRLDAERNWLFALLATAGSLLVIAASAIVQYLRESKATAADLRIAATAFESQEGIVITDVNDVILRINQAFTAITGYAAEDAVGRQMNLLKSDRHDSDFYAAMWKDILRDGTWRGEIWNRTRSGDVHPHWLTISAVRDSNNVVTHYVGTYTDITERKQIEEELKNQREHLEELVDLRTIELTQALEVAKVADQTKDAFLANMSHELRTPLSAVIGIANLAQGISTEPRLRDYLDKIVRSGKHLNRIINELLDLSKIAAGHMELEIISFSLSTVTAHVESVMSHRAAEKGLAIVMVTDDAVPDVLLGDPTRLAQIFLNLIGNAIKFTQVGRITVRVGLQASEENRVCLGIDFEDTGIGMGPEDLKQLFKPFTQADVSVSRKFGGTGLGLTISRRLAEMMGGDISVTSIEGGGTTFKVSLWLGLGDAADLPAVGQDADEALPVHYRNVRILVADDQPLNREIVAALLAAVGITPGLAENGQQALDILTESGPDAFDLVLMDIQMPVMDGLTATRALRSLAGFEKLPIIAMTAHTMTHEKENNAAAGMNDHIGKPFDNAAFYRTLAKWIPRSKQSSTHATAALPAQPEALPDARNELSSLRGVDVAAALARFCGNEVSYRRWLTEFAATAGDVPGQMRSEIAAGQADKAGKLAHAFKGRVGMLGMTELHGMVSALESALHECAPTDELLSTLERSVGEMRSELARVVSPGKADAADTATAPQVLESVVWNDTYSVGVPALDDQHKKLVGMINTLADCHATCSCKSSGAFHQVLTRMFDYSQLHFKAEEDYLLGIGYPQLADQKMEHTAFVGKMAAFSMAASEGIQDDAAVHRYLKAWLLSHILDSDMQYRYFVEENDADRR
jgi:hemerythrin-like metal-binding protein/PAS domain S-box-containing protein